MISSHLFEAYLDCPTKCWLRAQNEPATGNVYAEWRCAKNESYRKEWLERRSEADRILLATLEANPKAPTWRFAVDMGVQANDLECRIPAVERVHSEERGRRVQFIPYRFEFSNKLTKQQKLMVAFDALVLSDAIGGNIRLGKIVHGDRSTTLNVETSSLVSEVRMHIKSSVALVANTSAPDLVLNRHCSQCEFQGRCHKQARGKDDLSLMGGMSDKEPRSFTTRVSSPSRNYPTGSAHAGDAATVWVRAQRVRVPGARSYQQSRILGLPTRARLCEISLQNEVQADAKDKTQDRAEAQYVNRISSTVAVSNLPFQADLSSWWQKKYDPYRPEIHAVRRQAMDRAAPHPTVPMSVLPKNVLPSRLALDR
jgi:hypothetical protein